MFLFLQRISVFLLIYLLLAGLLIAISIANGVLTILKVSRGSLGSGVRVVWVWDFSCVPQYVSIIICVHHRVVWVWGSPT